MLIVCPHCATSYNVDATSLGAAGRSVRCVRCRSVWQAYPPEMAQRRAEQPAATAPATQAAPAPAPQFVRVQTGTDTAQAPPPVAPPPPRDEVFAEETPAAPYDAARPDQPAGGQAPPLLAESPPLVPTDLDNGQQPDINLHDDPPVTEDIEAVAARRAARERRLRRRTSFALPMPVIILALVALHGGLIAMRQDVVRALPQTASLYAAIGLPVNLRGLTFTDLKTTKEAHEGVPVLAIEGAIVSQAKGTVNVPRLRFSVRNDSGQEIYTWTALPTQTSLAPGETLPFRSRLASPPDEGRDVVVRFFTRRDIAAGFQ